MIIDHIKNAGMYEGMHQQFAAAFKYAANNPLADMETGKYEIQGSDLFLLIQSYETRPFEEGFWEAHRNYIDIQYILQGTEKMGYAHTSHLTVTEDHLDEKDYAVMEGKGDFLDVREGFFTIFYPDDAHMPCLATDQPASVKKAVFKIRLADA